MPRDCGTLQWSVLRAAALAVTMGVVRLLTIGAIFGVACAATPAHARDLVPFADAGISPGTIVIRTAERRLYFVTGHGQAVRYPVGVGRAGMQWSGQVRVEGKFLQPDWAPPAVVRRDNPSLPEVIHGGSPRNPLGVAALTLTGGDYAIHGTNNPKSIGGFVSYGCIRMHNADISDLYARVRVGTPVVVTH